MKPTTLNDLEKRLITIRQLAEKRGSKTIEEQACFALSELSHLQENLANLSRELGKVVEA